MKVLINTAHQRFGGGVQVALSFIYECINFTDHEYHVILGEGLQDKVTEANFPDNFIFYKLSFGIIEIGILRKIQKNLSAIENKIKPDCIISTTGPTYFKSVAPQIVGFNLPLYIYPESPFLRKMSLINKVRFMLKKRLHVYFFKRDADVYVVQTDDVNKRVRRLLNTDKVTTVTNSYNHFFDKAYSIGTFLPPKKGHEFRFVTVSSWYPHKNLELIPEIASVLKKEGLDNIRFILTIQDEEYSKLVPVHLQDMVINVGPVQPAECPSIYTECDAMFLPTLAECFSASYPEAMKMKKPIVTTDLGFARSICGEAALYFNPSDAFSAVDQVIKLYNDVSLQNRLKDLGSVQLNNFDTASERAKKYLELCKRVVDERKS